MGAYLLNKEQTVHRAMAVQHGAGQNRAVYYNHPKSNRDVLGAAPCSLTSPEDTKGKELVFNFDFIMTSVISH